MHQRENKNIARAVEATSIQQEKRVIGMYRRSQANAEPHAFAG